MPIILARKSRLRAKLELYVVAPVTLLLGVLSLPVGIGLLFLAAGGYAIHSNLKFLRATDPKRALPPQQSL